MQTDNCFDAVILGTGLTESIVAAALAQAGFKLAHIDLNPYYGADEASLSVDDLIHWAQERSGDIYSSEASSSYMLSQRMKFTSISCSSTSLPHARQYSLSLSPSIIPSVGPFISSLISSGVAKYGGFRLLERVGIYDPSGSVKLVPGNKEDIFKDKKMSLVEKRRLMEFLMFAAGDFEGAEELSGKESHPLSDFLQDAFSLTGEMASMIIYSIAFCTSSSEPALPALVRIRRYLRSAGRYGASPFLVGHYGGSGEIAQGFCRTSAVHGSTYILAKKISSIVHCEVGTESGEDQRYEYSVKLEDLPQELNCGLIISPSDYLPNDLKSSSNLVLSNSGHLSPPSIARGIAIFDQPINFSGYVPTPSPESSRSDFPTSGDSSFESHTESDTSLLIFPPSSIEGGSSTMSVTALVTGQGTMSAPHGKCTLGLRYLSVTNTLTLGLLQGIVYLSMTLPDSSWSSAESLLRPYLDVVLSLASSTSTLQPLFKTFYIQRPSATPVPTSTSSATLLVTPSPVHLLSEAPDSAATNAEAVFWKAVPILQAMHRRRHATSHEGESREIGTFWSMIPPDEEEDANEGW